MKNAINWFEIPSSDFDRATSFYTQILAEPLHLMEMGEYKMSMLPSDQEGTGGCVTNDSKMTPSDQGTMVYLNVDGKLDEVVGRVEGAGGTIIVPRTSIGEHGFIAVIRDTEGNAVGLHSSK